MDSIVLPELALGPIKYPIGEAYLVLRGEQVHRVVSEEPIQVSPRVKETSIVLCTGERIVVTERERLPCPEGVDAVLRKHETGVYEWLSHRLLSAAYQRINKEGLSTLATEAVESWRQGIRYKAENKPVVNEDDYGLRPPQLGALFSIGSHWSLSKSPGTIVMPTGTGKTETMLAVLPAHKISRMLVAVPSRALRAQTAEKFKRFGLLRTLNVLDKTIANPVVGIVRRRPRSNDELSIFKDCNVVVGVVSSLAGGTAYDYLSAISQDMDLLVVDEAHHVAAPTWLNLKNAFQDKKILQFTATPYRNDGKLVDGSVIYSYPMKSAQDDEYFKEITFVPVHELDDALADEVIARVAVDRLRAETNAGCDHLLMARCRSVERAEAVYSIYQALAPDFYPVLIHSEIREADSRVEQLRKRSSRIVVCVNMLGEGVDIPALKIAAVHDTHQSLAVLLQFVGRFTRTGGNNLGNASVIANVANPRVSSAVEQLYSEDADWNYLLREKSSEAAQEHAEFVRFLENSTPFEIGDGQTPRVSQHSLRPIFSTLFYEAPSFHPKRFHEGLSEKFQVVAVWLNESSRTLYFVTRSSEATKWSNTKELAQIEWNLFVLHHNLQSQLLYLASTNKDSNFDSLAKSVGATKQIAGENMFRSLGGIGRLVFNNLGVTKHGRRNLSFAMYTGADVKHALSETEKKGSRKSNISGYGWEDGRQVTIGCSYKGRVWSKAAGTIPQFIKWVEHIGKKLTDDTIDTRSILSNVLIPEYATALPECGVLSIEWPAELLGESEDRVVVVNEDREYEWFLLDIKCRNVDRDQSTIEFAIEYDDDQILATYRLDVNGEAGFQITENAGKNLQIRIGCLRCRTLAVANGVQTGWR